MDPIFVPAAVARIRKMHRWWGEGGAGGGGGGERGEEKDR